MANTTRTQKLFAELEGALNQPSNLTTQSSSTPAMPPPLVPTSAPTQTPKFVCQPRPYFDYEREHDIEEFEEQEMEALENTRQAEVKKVLGKSASQFPDHAWIISELGEWLYEKGNIEAQLRNQDSFGMHISNDWTGYGMQEVIENVVRIPLSLLLCETIETNLTRVPSCNHLPMSSRSLEMALPTDSGHTSKPWSGS
jgi:hypothetical protein